MEGIEVAVVILVVAAIVIAESFDSFKARRRLQQPATVAATPSTANNPTQSANRLRRALAFLSWAALAVGLYNLAGVTDPPAPKPVIALMIAIIAGGNGWLHWKAADTLQAGSVLTGALRLCTWVFFIGSALLAVVGWIAILSHASELLAMDVTRFWLGVGYHTFLTVSALAFWRSLR